MKRTCTLFQQHITYALLIGFFLQSCGGGFDNHLLISTGEEQIASIQTNTQEILGQTNIQTLIGRTLIAQKGHAVTFYEEAGKLKADVAMNAPQGFSKNYEGLGVYIEQDTDVSNLPRLNEKAQQRRIYLQPAYAGKPAKVVIYKGAGLVGGGSEDEDESLNAVLVKSAYKGNISKVNKLIAEGADVNAKGKYGRTALHSAAEGGHIELIKLLIAEGADVNAKNDAGITALHWAAIRGHIEPIKLLIEKYKVDVNAKTKDGYTALHFAAREGRIELIKLLIEEYKADVNAKNDFGITVLHSAAQRGHIELIKLLIEEYKADVNAKTKDGRTALHFAVKESRHIKRIMSLIEKHKHNAYVLEIKLKKLEDDTTLARELLEKGADVNIQNDNGDAPLNLIIRKSLQLRTILESVNTEDKSMNAPVYKAEMEKPLVVQVSSLLEANDILLKEMILKYSANVYAENIRKESPISMYPTKINEILLMQNPGVKDKHGHTMRSQEEVEKQSSESSIINEDIKPEDAEANMNYKKRICPNCESACRHVHKVTTDEGTKTILICEQCDAIWINPNHIDWGESVSDEILEKEFGEDFSSKVSGFATLEEAGQNGWADHFVKNQE